MKEEEINILNSLDKEEVIKYLGLDTPKPESGKPDGKYYDETHVKELREEAKKHRLKKEELERILSELQPKVSTYEVELNTLKTAKSELDTLRTEIKSDLLSKLPEDKREGYKDFDIPVLKRIVTDFITTQKPVDSPGTAGDRTPKIEKTWEQMTHDERNEMLNTNKPLAEKLQAEYFKTYFKH